MTLKTNKIAYLFYFFLSASLLTLTSCSSGESSAPAGAPAAAGPVKTIQSEQDFKKIIESQPDRLMVFDLYADWCGPCRQLSPMLEEIAKEVKEKADFYKINVDKHPQLAGAFKVRGIPHVAFLKNKTILHTFVGVRPKSAYIRAVNLLAETNTKEDKKEDKEEAKAREADGTIVDGIRVIQFKAGINPYSIYVYRGETVKLILPKQDFDYSVHIPQYKISQSAELNKPLEVQFKAKTIGVFPIFCNGNCPAGDGAMHGQIVVMQYKAEGEAQFTEMTAAEAKQKIDSDNPLILDVRTPQEFYSGHIPGAKLIPLQQLSQRLSEIEDFKEKDIVVYCRSGNRSTVAGQIMIEKGFKKIFNIRSGIKGWINGGYDVKKATPSTVL